MSQLSVTMDHAERFRMALCGPDNLCESVHSACLRVGLNPGTVRKLMSRYLNEPEGMSPETQAIVHHLCQSKAQHLKEIRMRGMLSAEDKNGPGASFWIWRAETAAPEEHPRKSEQHLEVTGKDGAPLSGVSLADLVKIVRDTQEFTE